MTKSIQKRIRKTVLILIGVFVLMYFFRLMYGYSITVDDNNSHVEFFSDFASGKKNYASRKYEKGGAKNTLSSQGGGSVDQKYEKIAEVSSKSDKFVEEEKLLRSLVSDNLGIIQFEQKNGNEGYRNLNLLIGVPPENFDHLYQKLIEIGRVQSKQITKKDKTNEYKELNAKKASLEKIRNSLIDLKSKGGQIEEYINLENRILSIEEELQSLGVNLGDFDEENEFCTVRFSLIEGKVTEISTMHRLKVAFEWTVKFYLRLILIGLFVLGFAYLLILLIDKTKILQQVLKK